MDSDEILSALDDSDYVDSGSEYNPFEDSHESSDESDIEQDEHTNISLHNNLARHEYNTVSSNEWFDVSGKLYW